MSSLLWGVLHQLGFGVIWNIIFIRFLIFSAIIIITMVLLRTGFDYLMSLLIFSGRFMFLKSLYVDWGLTVISRLTSSNLVHLLRWPVFIEMLKSHLHASCSFTFRKHQSPWSGCSFRLNRSSSCKSFLLSFRPPKNPPVIFKQTRGAWLSGSAVSLELKPNGERTWCCLKFNAERDQHHKAKQSFIY